MGGSLMKKLTASDLYRYVSTGEIRLFPQGKRFLFTKRVMDRKENGYISNIWSMDTSGRNLRQLTFGKNDSMPRVSPDGEKIAFLSKREKESKGTELYILPMNGGEARFIRNMKGGISQVEWLDNENLGIVYSARPDNSEPADEPLEKKIYEIERIPFLSNGSGYTEGKLRRAALISAKSGKLKDITGGYSDVQLMKFSPDGKKALLIITDDPESKPRWRSLYILDLSTSDRRKISSDDTSVFYADWKDNKSLYMISTDYDRGFASSNFVDFFDLDSMESRPLIGKEEEISFGNTLNSDVRGVGGNQFKVLEEKLFFLQTQKYETVLKSVDSEGCLSTILSPGESIDCFDVAPGKVIIFNSMNFTSPLELSIYRNEKVKKLTAFNRWLKGFNISRPEHMGFQASDGTIIDGWAMKPVDFNEEGSYPSVLEIHGGPRTAYGSAYIHEFQVLAAAGYVVLFCNPRGSDGYGSDFADIRAHYGERDFEDILEFVEFAVDNNGWIDSERLGVTGGSYGGFMTNWIIGHTDIFKAAVSQRSISNWISFFGTTDIGYFFAEDQTGGNFWDNMENYVRQSPLFYAPNVETPVMFIHSLEDYRCWVPEAMQFFTALRYLGKDAKMILFPRENHELSRGGIPAHREKRLDSILNWFKLHLDGTDDKE